jgi:hypothetical protein
MNRETPTPGPGPEERHRECWDLLPWLITGRLGERDRKLVESHLPGCAECRAELEAERRLHDEMSREDRVVHSPAASFEKLWSRIEELEREAPEEHSERTHAPGPGPRKRTRLSPDASLLRWLVAAVVVQSIAIGWLASTVVSQRTAPPWPYRTVTSPSAPAVTPHYRIVLAPNVSVTELQRMLATHGLVIVQTSPGSEVFTLAFDAGHAPANAASALESLRQEASVRFVELVPAPSAP